MPDDRGAARVRSFALAAALVAAALVPGERLGVAVPVVAALMLLAAREAARVSLLRLVFGALALRPRRTGGSAGCGLGCLAGPLGRLGPGEPRSGRADPRGDRRTDPRATSVACGQAEAVVALDTGVARHCARRRSPAPVCVALPAQTRRSPASQAICPYRPPRRCRPGPELSCSSLQRRSAWVSPLECEASRGSYPRLAASPPWSG